MNEDQILKQKLSQQSPEMQRWNKIDLLVSPELNDVLSDLSYEEITVVSLYRAIHKELIEIPGVMQFFDNIISLRRSMDRKGRQELVEILKKRPDYLISGYGEEEGEEKISKFKKIFPWNWGKP